MLSALIPPVGRKPAVPLAGQLAHESYVRPGPLVLGTAFLRSLTAASDRDRHFCYHRPNRPGASTFLPGSACRHADRTISSPQSLEMFGVWSLRILDGLGADQAFPADFPHRSDCHWSWFAQPVLPNTREFQHLAKFIDSAEYSHCLTTF